MIRRVVLDGRCMPGGNSRNVVSKLAMLVSPRAEHGRAGFGILQESFGTIFSGTSVRTDGITSASVLLSLNDMLLIWAIGTCASILPIEILLKMTLDARSECASTFDRRPSSLACHCH